MRHDGTRRILLPGLVLSQTCTANCAGAIRRTVYLDGHTIEYFYRPLSAAPLSERDTRTSSYNHVPIVVDASGAPWAHASIYLVDIVEKAGLPSDGIDTAQPIGTDLADYKRFLDGESLDFQTFPDLKRRRPTYRYRAHLIAKIEAGELKRSVCRRRMSSVIGFYRWLKRRKLLAEDTNTWDEKDKLISFSTREGSRRLKHVKVTDVAIHAPVKSPPTSEFIVDGGRLRPLPFDEQAALLDILLAHKNTEMRLIIMLMMLSGARTQTALTLRARDFLDELMPSQKEVRIPTGPGTGVDTKGNSADHTLQLPAWFYVLVRTYALSERAASRRRKSGRPELDAYLFLTNRGKPYFESKADRSKFDPSVEAGQANKGAALQAFIRKYLLPALRKKLGKQFALRAHDLRATAGMNKNEQLMEAVRRGKLNLNQARDRLREFLWHANSATTDLYINYKHDREMFLDIQSRFESHLVQLMEKASGDGWEDDGCLAGAAT